MFKLPDPIDLPPQPIDPRWCENCATLEGLIPTIDPKTGNRVLTPCPCRANKLPGERWLRATRDVENLRHCTFDNLACGVNGALFRAKTTAQKFCAKWPYELAGKGVIFTGSYGQGKTHLAMAMLRELIYTGKVKRGAYVNERRLFQQIRDTYDENATGREELILNPVVAGLEVLVLDELGTQKQTEWAQNKIADILDTRLNKGLTTIITTNYDMDDNIDNVRSLIYRVGELCYSRICEMCIHCPTGGDDYRKGPGRATEARLLQ